MIMHQCHPVLLSNGCLRGFDRLKQACSDPGDRFRPSCPLDQEAGSGAQFGREGAAEAVALQFNDGPDGHLRKTKGERSGSSVVGGGDPSGARFLQQVGDGVLCR